MLNVYRNYEALIQRADFDARTIETDNLSAQIYKGQLVRYVQSEIQYWF